MENRFGLEGASECPVCGEETLTSVCGLDVCDGCAETRYAAAEGAEEEAEELRF